MVDECCKTIHLVPSALHPVHTCLFQLAFNLCQPIAFTAYLIHVSCLHHSSSISLLHIPLSIHRHIQTAVLSLHEAGACTAQIINQPVARTA